MKYLLPLILLLASFNAVAVSLTLDPTIEGQKNFTMTCLYPVEREDGTPLSVSEIAKVSFFVEKNGVGGYLPAGENTTACRQVYDLTSVADGVYVYAVTAVDTDGRERLYSDEVATITVKRLSNPASPTGVNAVAF